MECKKENDLLSLQNLQLKDEYPSLWQAKKEKIRDAAYEDGFKGYVLGFLATDHEYSWEKFDHDSHKWIDDFKAENGPVIATKKKEIEDELARLKDNNANVATNEIPPQLDDTEACREDFVEKRKSPAAS